MSSMISRTKEAISVGGWKSDTYLVLEIRNEGGVGVFIRREVKTAVQILLYIGTGDNVYTIPKSKTLVSNNIHIPSMGKVYLGYDLSSEISSYSRAKISFVSVMITTERNTFVFDVVPPIDSTVLTITKKDIETGATYIFSSIYSECSKTSL